MASAPTRTERFVPPTTTARAPTTAARAQSGESSRYCIPTWWGICHAWAPAAIVEQEPQCDVEKNGVTFHVFDIKVLLTDLYDGASIKTIFTGARLNGPDSPPTDHEDNGKTKPTSPGLNKGFALENPTSTPVTPVTPPHGRPTPPPQIPSMPETPTLTPISTPDIPGVPEMPVALPNGKPMSPPQVPSTPEIPMVTPIPSIPTADYPVPPSIPDAPLTPAPDKTPARLSTLCAKDRGGVLIIAALAIAGTSAQNAATTTGVASLTAASTTGAAATGTTGAAVTDTTGASTTGASTESSSTGATGAATTSGSSTGSVAAGDTSSATNSMDGSSATMAGSSSSPTIDSSSATDSSSTGTTATSSTSGTSKKKSMSGSASASGSSVLEFRDAALVELVAARGQLGARRRERLHAHDAHGALAVQLLPDVGRVALERLHEVHGGGRHAVELRDDVADDGVHPARALEQQQRVLDLRVGGGGVPHVHADGEVHGRLLASSRADFRVRRPFSLGPGAEALAGASEAGAEAEAGLATVLRKYQTPLRAARVMVRRADFLGRLCCLLLPLVVVVVVVVVAVAAPAIPSIFVTCTPKRRSSNSNFNRGTPVSSCRNPEMDRFAGASENESTGGNAPAPACSELASTRQRSPSFFSRRVEAALNALRGREKNSSSMPAHQKIGIIMDMAVTLEELYNGAQKQAQFSRNVICRKCRGTGAKGGKTTTCKTCGGSGHVLVEQKMGPGFTVQMQQPCPKCGGKGKTFKHACPFCHGNKVVKEDKVLTADIERGMPSSHQIVFERESEQRPGMVPGDVIFRLHQVPHNRFRRAGDDLHYDLDISLEEALLGYKKPMKHLDDRTVVLTNAKVTTPFEVRTVEGEGMPVHNYPSQHGNLHVHHEIRFPKKLSVEQKELVKELLPEDPVTAVQETSHTIGRNPLTIALCSQLAILSMSTMASQDAEATHEQWKAEQLQLKTQLIETDVVQWHLGSHVGDAAATAETKSCRKLSRVAGVDISFLKGSNEHACASIVVLEYPSLSVLYEAFTYVSLPAPYIAGFLAFREVPALTKLYDDLRRRRPGAWKRVCRMKTGFRRVMVVCRSTAGRNAGRWQRRLAPTGLWAGVSLRCAGEYPHHRRGQDLPPRGRSHKARCERSHGQSSRGEPRPGQARRKIWQGCCAVAI
ncbi:hypothetical protein ON010_g4701 [Phytophthora cinnamomi]|nr:hypothetical protein ON010_g4701 [Phytophthora cinnamomi]